MLKVMTTYGCSVCGRADWDCGKADCPNMPRTKPMEN
jgi:hypothetical protein